MAYCNNQDFFSAIYLNLKMMIISFVLSLSLVWASFSPELLQKVNEARAQVGSGPLTIMPELSALAQRHSASMAAEEKLNSVGYPILRSRIRREGLRPRLVGEVNTINSSKNAEVLSSVKEEDMKTVMNPLFTRIGFGRTRKNGKSFWTLFFAQMKGDVAKPILEEDS